MTVRNHNLPEQSDIVGKMMTLDERKHRKDLIIVGAREENLLHFFGL
jgi:hypothetical protein